MPNSVEAIIQEAMRRGEFDDLPGKGRPVDLSAYFEAPEDQRLAFSILKNAGVLPPEAELLGRIETARRELAACTDPDRRRQLERQIRSDELQFRLRIEKQRQPEKRGRRR